MTGQIRDLTRLGRRKIINRIVSYISKKVFICGGRIPTANSLAAFSNTVFGTLLLNIYKLVKFLRSLVTVGNV